MGGWESAARTVARRYAPPSAGRLGKRIAVQFRYLQQLSSSRRGFADHGSRYPHPVLFIAGLPKSGTTWLKRMITSYPGFREVMIPDVVRHELTTGGSHDYDLPEDVFSRMADALAVIKLHVHGSAHNAALLSEWRVPYVILYRDLRDIAVSYYFYVRQTPWHPEYRIYEKSDLDAGLRRFADTMLPAYVRWIDTWQKHRSPSLSLVLRYEDLLADTPRQFRRVATHFGLDASSATIDRIVSESSFKALSGGRERGSEDNRSFFRKGIAGDWENHFSDELRERFRAVVGDSLTRLGDEE